MKNLLLGIKLSDILKRSDAEWQADYQEKQVSFIVQLNLEELPLYDKVVKATTRQHLTAE